MTSTREAVRIFVREHPGATNKDIATALCRSECTIAYHTHKDVQEGHLRIAGDPRHPNTNHFVVTEEAWL